MLGWLRLRTPAPRPQAGFHGVRRIEFGFVRRVKFGFVSRVWVALKVMFLRYDMSFSHREKVAAGRMRVGDLPALLLKNPSRGLRPPSLGGRGHLCDTSHNDERGLLAKEAAPLSCGWVRRSTMTSRSARRVWLRFAARLASFGAASLASFRGVIGFVRRGEFGVASLYHLRGFPLNNGFVWRIVIGFDRRGGLASFRGAIGFVRRGGLAPFRRAIGFVRRGGLASFRIGFGLL